MTLKIVTFHQIYEKYADDVYRFAYYLSGNQDDAKDLTSDTFVRLWATSSEIKTATVKQYLITITKNLYLKMRAKQQKQIVLDDSHIDSTPTVDKKVEEKSELNHFLKILQSVPDDEKLALLLYAIEGYSYKEIAGMLNISLENVKIKISRVREKLKNQKEY